MKYIIQSIHRPEGEAFFVAFHGFTAFYSSRNQARPFDSPEEARAYAIAELFTNETAFAIVTATPTPAAPIFSDESTTEERTQLHRDEYAARPKLPIAKIREIIRSGFHLRDMLTGGTAEEFARQNCGPDLMARAGEIQALHIPERFAADRAEGAAEVERLLTTAQRWCQRRKEYLDTITKDATAFPTFQALLEAPGGYFPSLSATRDNTRFLARCYDECQAARGDSRRAFLS